MLSVVVTNYYWDLPDLKECVKSFQGHCDELIVISGQETSLSQKINKGFEMSSGDYIIISNDDCKLHKGTLRDLQVPGAVTSPLINGAVRGEFSGHIFCVPREVYNITGGYDERYEQAYFDDDDFIFTLNKHNIPMMAVLDVDISHPPLGATTLDEIKKEKGDFYERNKQKFLEKWGRLP